MRKTIYLLLILAGIAQLAAAEPMTLTEELSVQMALEQNLSLQASKLDLEMTEDQNKNSWNNFLPDFSVSSGLSRSDSLLNSDSTTGSWALSGSVDASITLNKSAVKTMTNDRLSYEAQTLLYQMDEDKLIVEVKKDFYYLLAHKESLELERKNLDLAAKRWSQTEKNFKSGLASALDVLESRNSYESLRPSYTNTKTSYETQLMSFKSLIGLKLGQEIKLDGELNPEILELDAEKLVQHFLGSRGDVRSSLKSVEVKENLLSFTGLSNRSPSLTLSLDWTNSDADIGSNNLRDSLSVSGYLTIPLNGFIPGSEESLEISNAKIAVTQAKLNYQNTIYEADQEIRIIVMKLEGYKENIEITKQSVLLAEQTYKMTEAAYNQGTKEMLYLEEAQNTLFSAQQDLLQSRYNYLSGFLDLEYALNSSTEKIMEINK